MARLDEAIPKPQLEQLDTLLQRRALEEPIAYITGTREFWSLELIVTPATLIPRADTETLVEQTLEKIPTEAEWTLADLGTGSGAIALAIARERPRCQIIATDISQDAIEVASQNATAHGISNIRFRQGSWYLPLQHQRMNLIVCNPPYIRQDDPHLQQGDVQHEPFAALAAGKDGMDALRMIIEDAPRHLQPGGWLLLEHGYNQGAAVKKLFMQAGFEALHCQADLANHDRVSLGRTALSL